ncbi:MAG: hypothetical protein MZU79_06380 [Anaerotruncus sp.]|nr:hypothetical protein [Anaerotruncus sp.]
MASDGVVFASPNLSFQVSGMMKVFLDRLGFVFHRPRFFGKALDEHRPAGHLRRPEDRELLSFHRQGDGLQSRPRGAFHRPRSHGRDGAAEDGRGPGQAEPAVLQRSSSGRPYPWPGWFYFMAFRSGRTKMQLELDETSFDYRYYRGQGLVRVGLLLPHPLGPAQEGRGPSDRLRSKRGRPSADEAREAPS